MIPEEVAQIAYLLREEFDHFYTGLGRPEDAHSHSISVAWKIYNMTNQQDAALMDKFLK